MYCQKCGTKLNENQNFCQICGTAISENTIPQKKDNGKSILMLKPKFLILPTLITVISLVLIVMIAVFLFIPGSPMVALIVGGSTFVMSIAFFIADIITRRYQYNRMSYTFYQNRVIYESHTWHKVQKEISYHNISEIKMQQNIFQKWFHVGDIILYSHAYNNSDNGITLVSIPNVEEVYEKVQALINQ